MPLTSATTMANSAGYFHPGRRRARITKASIQGSPDHGMRMTEMRPAYWSTYGVNMKARAATYRPGPAVRWMTRQR